MVQGYGLGVGQGYDLPYYLKVGQGYGLGMVQGFDLYLDGSKCISSLDKSLLWSSNLVLQSVSTRVSRFQVTRWRYWPAWIDYP